VLVRDDLVWTAIPFHAGDSGMMQRRDLGLLATGLAAILLVGCGSSKEYRYKVTVEIETPQGTKIGSSVWGITPIRTNSMVGPQAKVDFRGEAVAVDLPGGKTLFALLSSADGIGDYAQQLPGRALRSQFYGKEESPPRDSAEIYPTAPDTLGLHGTNPLPMLVTFGDVRDPKSVLEVKPDALDKTFGAGVRLKRIGIAVTDEPVTVGIARRFSWWQNLKVERRRLNGSNSIAVSTNKLADNIGTGVFSVGVSE
jgi:hypothetical protein